jgi:surface polysaccharide O-acyltransferase-like enzyme
MPPTNINPSIIIDKCEVNNKFLDTLYLWLMPGLITALVILLCIAVIAIVDNPFIVLLGGLFIACCSIYVPYYVISERISKIKRNCVDYGKAIDIPVAIPIVDKASG